MANLTAVRAAARLKQISCLGLVAEVAIPAMLEELRSLIPSRAHTFVFTDVRGATTNVFFETPDFAKLFPLYHASNEKVAAQLGISRHTANQHGRWIYDKLDVHNRAELVGRLLATPTSH